MPELKAVIFDLGRVLVGLDLRRGLFSRLVDAVGAEEDADAVVARLVADDLFKRFNRGEITPEAFRDEACARTGLDVPFDEFCKLWCAVFDPQPAMEALFHAVRARYAVGLLSDTDPIHWQHLRERFPFLQEIDRPTLSYRLGFMKPDPRIYAEAARNVGCEPSACLFIDDMDANVEGARACGMQAIRFTDHAQLVADLSRMGVDGMAEGGGS